GAATGGDDQRDVEIRVFVPFTARARTEETHVSELGPEQFAHTRDELADSRGLAGAERAREIHACSVRGWSDDVKPRGAISNCEIQTSAMQPTLTKPLGDAGQDPLQRGPFEGVD